jgi:hypothetical protein
MDNNKNVLTLEYLREAIGEAIDPVFKPVYKQHSLKEIMLNKELTTTERILLQFLSIQDHEVKGSFIMENLGLKGKGFRNNIEKLLERGLVRKGKGYSTWVINQSKKGIL